MYNVFRNGIHHSGHPDYADACRHARMQATKDRQAYFTVFKSGKTGEKLYQVDVMRGLPAYIVQPTARQ